MELYIICTLFLLLNSGLTVNGSRRSRTTDGKRYFNNVVLGFKNTLLGLFSYFVARGRNGDGFGSFCGGQRGWAKEDPSCKQTHTSQLSGGEMVNLDAL